MTAAGTVLADFAAAAAERGAATVLIADTGHGTERVAYRTLRRRVNALAQRLAASGLGPEHRVAVAADRSAHMITAVFGALTAGCAYVPFDPDDPRCAELLSSVGVSAVVGPAGLADAVGAVHVPTHLLTAEAETPPAVRIDPANLAYLVFTSGTTGRPKPVAIEHRSLDHFARWGRSFAADTTDAVFLQFANLTFDASVWEIYTALTAGAALLLLPAAVVASPVDLEAAIARHGVTHLDVPAPVLESMNVRHLSALRFCMTGADAVPARTVHHCTAPGRVVVNGYGPTEVTDMTVVGICDPASPDPPPLGFPIGETQAHVLDPTLAPVETGELFLGGPQLARGYDGYPGLTAERFLPNPWGKGDRLYRTGDLVHRPPGGAIGFLGRLDRQVKIRGRRVELEEVETAIAGCPGVRHAAVVAPTVGEQRRLVAHVAVEAELASVRAELDRRLPAALRPSAWVTHRRLPLNRNGKVDHRALERLGLGTGPTADPGDRPLFRVASRVLGRPVDTGSSLLRQGGDSLDAMRIAARLRTEGLAVDARDLLTDLPLGRVRLEPARLEPARQSESGASGLPPAAADKDWAPLTPNQLGMWYLHLLRPRSPAFHLPVRVDLTGPLDRAAFCRSWAAVLHRHEGLRCQVTHRDGRPGWTATAAGPDLPFLDLAGAAHADAALERTAQEQAKQPFDPRREAMRARLVRIAEDRHALLVTAHHLVCDGWSFGLMLRDLDAAYRGAALGDGPGLLGYARGVGAGGDAAYAAGVRYWCDVLRGDHPPVLGTPGRLSGVPVGRVFDLPAGALRAAFRHLGVTPFVGLLAGFARAAADLTGHRRLPIGLVTANRDTVGAEEVVGMLANTVVLPVSADGQPADMASRLGREVRSSLPYWGTPLPLVMSALRPGRSTSGQPLFQLMFEFDNTPSHRLRAGRLRGRFSDEGFQQGAVAELSLRIFARGEHFRCVLVGDAAVFGGAELDDLVARCGDAIAAMAGVTVDGGSGP